MVGDPINERLILINGSDWSSPADDVWVIDLDTGEWLEFLAPSAGS